MAFKQTLAVLALAFASAPCAAQLPPTCMLFDAGFLNNSIGGVVQTSDGGVALCGGYAEGNSGYGDVLVTKLDANGALQWMKAFGTGQNQSEYGLAIVSTNDGGVAVAGYLDAGSVFILKLDADGDQ